MNSCLMRYKKTSTIGGIIILIFFLIGIYGLNAFELYDNNRLIELLTIYLVILIVIISLVYSFFTILNEENYTKISAYFLSGFFSLIIGNFLFWGTLGNLLLLNDLLNANTKNEIVKGTLIDVYQVGDKGEHYETRVLIDSDTVRFSINEEKFNSLHGKRYFHEVMQKGYLGILYK